jgi:hypothetical protein
MEVDQVKAGTTTTGIGSVTQYVSELVVFSGGGGVARFTTQQVTDAPVGLKKSYKFSVTTADTSIASSDLASIALPVEGYRMAGLGFGTAGAKSISFGFWCKANRTGTYSLAIVNYTFGRSYPLSFTINASGTWEWKTFTIPGDTTGTWASDNTCWGYLNICLMAGTAQVGAAGAWANAGYSGVTGTINGVAATSDYFQITGVVLIAGNYLLPSYAAERFIRPFDEELLLCQRYYEKSYDYGQVPGHVDSNGCLGWSAGLPSPSGSGQGAMIDFKVRKRTQPTLTFYSTATGATGKARDIINNTDVTATIAGGTGGGEMDQAIGAAPSAATAGPAFLMHWIADARM